MLLKRGDTIPRQLLQVALDGGGLGDQLARLVAVRESLRLAAYLDLRLFVAPAHKELVLACTDLQEYLANGRLLVFTHDEQADNVNVQQPGVQFSKRTMTPGRLSLVDEGLLVIADTLDDIEGRPVNKDYVTIIGEPVVLLPRASEYRKIVAVTSEATTPVRTMQPEETRKLCQWLTDRGHYVILLGHGLKSPRYPAALDLRGDTTLLEAQSVLDRCDYVVGLDNGLLHLAGTCASNPVIVAGYTSINPKYREIGRPEANYHVRAVTNVTVDEVFCQSQHNFLFEHDFRDCLYGDNLVANTLLADDFKITLKQEGL